MNEVDVAIVGAGAAGLAAARRLRERGVEALLLEARSRIGGRAHTVVTATGYPVDLGCGWLHSADRNPWVGLARGYGLSIDETQPGWGERLARQGFTADEQAHWFRTREEFYARLERTASEADRPASDLLEPGNRWNELLNAVSTWANGVELDRLSAHDYHRYDDTGLNWRVREGYGALVERFGEGLSVRLSTPVLRIDGSGRLLRLETPAGTLVARALILAVPPSVVAADGILFSPPLPAEKYRAAHGLPLGGNNKLFLSLSGDWPEFGANWHVTGSFTRTRTAAYQMRPHGRPIAEMFLGGRLGVELEAAGVEAMADFAREELSVLFGNRIRAALAPLAHSAWNGDPYSRGSYSAALPGHADDRAVWAAPLDERIFFAGEATSLDQFSTTHGAYLTGLAAADRVLAAAR